MPRFKRLAKSPAIVTRGRHAHDRLVPEPSPLDDPRKAAHAWARFRGMMRLMCAVTAVAIAGAMVVIYSQNGVESIHLYIATALGIGFAMLLTGALMSLVFMSSGTGHDESVDTANPPEWDRQD